MVRKRLHEQVVGLRKYSTNRFTIYYGDDFIPVMKDFVRIVQFGAQAPLLKAEIKGKHRFSPTVRELIKFYVDKYWEKNKKERTKEKKESEKLNDKEAKIKEELAEIKRKQYGDDYEEDEDNEDE
jgi:hypothetical protein